MITFAQAQEAAQRLYNVYREAASGEEPMPAWNDMPRWQRESLVWMYYRAAGEPHGQPPSA